MVPGLVAGAAQNKTLPIVAGVLVVGAVVGSYFLIIRPIMKKVGVIKDKEYTKLIKKLTTSNKLDPNYFDESKRSISHSRAKEIAHLLNGSFFVDYGSGIDFGTHVEETFAALRSAKNAHDMSLISFYFQNRYGKSLVDTMIDELDEDELRRVAQTLSL